LPAALTRVRTQNENKAQQNELSITSKMAFAVTLIMIVNLCWFTFRPVVADVMRDKEIILRAFSDFPDRVCKEMVTQFQEKVQVLC